MCGITFKSSTKCNNCKKFDDCYGEWEKANADQSRKDAAFRKESWKDAMRTYKGRGKRFVGG